jgi:hypothetical protein
MSPGGALAENSPMEASQLKPALHFTFSNVPESPKSPFEERGVVEGSSFEDLRTWWKEAFKRLETN